MILSLSGYTDSSFGTVVIKNKYNTKSFQNKKLSFRKYMM